jgi:hypothetical protein
VVAIATFAVLVGGLVAFQPPESASAVTGSQFNPGNIISDSNFYNPNGMSQASIQTFLNSKIGICTNGNCLNVVSTSTTSRAADSMCGAYAGAASESTAAIIFKVQQACGISAQVILVTLQKEQGLITATSPSAAKLERAMGYACPDSANGACDPTYAGLYNQIYRAAWQFKRYANPPGTSASYNWYPIGKPVAIAYSPNVSAHCDSPAVTIQNKATAALYYYTPYQPNAPALANLSGNGDNCSTYGNRNFWVYYNTWFGNSTLPVGSPEGQFDNVSATYGQISMSGSAFDRDAPSAAVAMNVQIDSSWYAMSAGLPNASVGQNYPVVGPNHGFSGTFPAVAGIHTVCVYVTNQGAGTDLELGCFSITVPDGSPVGSLTSVTGLPNSVSVGGWALDTDQLNSPVPVNVQIDSKWFSTSANLTSTAAASAYPIAGANHGFAASFAIAPGVHTVCVYLQNQGLGGDSSLGCSSVSVVSQLPVGALSPITVAPGVVNLSGWTLDPDVITASLPVDIQVDSTWTRVVADEVNTAAQAQYPGAGLKHGFSDSISMTGGVHVVCVYVNNQGIGGQLGLGCSTVTVPAAPGAAAPVAVLTSVVPSAGGVAVAGWAVDADNLAAPLSIDVQLDSQWTRLTANQSNLAGGVAVPGAGNSHGFAGTIAGSPGAHTLCVYVNGVGGGAAQISLGCRGVTVTAAAGVAPQGALTSVVGGAGSVSLAGWAADADGLSTPLRIEVQLDSAWSVLTANQSSPAGGVAVPGAGNSHGFAGTVAASKGAHTLCVYVDGVGGGPAQISLGCHAVTVSAVAPPAGVAPRAVLTSVVPSAGGVAVAGWAVDADNLAAPLSIDVQLDSQWTRLTANQSNLAGGVAVPGAGNSHGFAGTIAGSPGAHTLCVYVNGVGGGAAQISLGCRGVTVP